ncbi:response regulator transcription factor [Heliomicrobium undosum]|uniref:response regulator transcription factor n=1 Tax=Heliomicrobium undosum TaxID=121734 RepID=UPI002E2CDA92|nr:response regulator transcription factor [Heliomicrobium undosum]
MVDDEAEIVDLLRDYLSAEGYQVTTAADGREALEKARLEKPDLAILDLMLPALDGFEVCRILRAESAIPIIILSAKEQEGDKVLGLGLGADDYLVKPFSPREVLARVRAQLRRVALSSGAPAKDDALRFYGLDIYPREYRVVRDGMDVSLQAREFQLLYFLARHPRQVFSKEQLYECVWGEDYLGDPNTLTVHIRRLREKIEPAPGKPQYIKTIWGVGYKFDGVPLGVLGVPQ